MVSNMNSERVPPLDPHQGFNPIRMSPFTIQPNPFDFTQQQQQQQQTLTPLQQQQIQLGQCQPQQLQPPVFKLADQSMEIVDRMIDKFIMHDNMFPSLLDKMRITCESGPTVSGLHETDYPGPGELPVQVQINQFKIINKVPIPPEILEQVGNIQADTLMGIFPEITRAWVCVESDLYMWDFQTGGDVAYYDGACDVIASVGLVTPRPGVFHSYINNLLVITTPIEIIVLGIVLNKSPGKVSDELQLTQDVLYSLPTDGVPIKVIRGTSKGRIFLGGQDGNIYELVYQKEIGWWGKRCKKVNLSKSSLSFIVPSFIAAAFTEVDPIYDIVVDESRNILYTLTSNGTIDVYDLGKCGTSSVFRVATLNYSTIHHQAVLTTQQLIHQRRRDLPEITNVCSLCPLEESDSPHLGLVGITKNGIRFYFSTGSPPPHRPSTLRLLHVRFPPGFNPTSPPFARDTLTVPIHKSGTFILATSNTSTVQDKVWCFSSDFYPARIIFSEETQFHNLCAPVVAVGELKTNGKSKAVCNTNGHILVYQQNINPNRFVLLTPQGTEVYEKLRPVDILAEILRERNGPDSDEIKHYFLEQSTDQACAMALILACTFMSTQAQLAEWATRAFFLYGGDPKHVIQPANYNIQQQYNQQILNPQIENTRSPPFDTTRQESIYQQTIPSGFRPNQVSTPLGERNQLRVSPTLNASVGLPQSETFTIQMSSKHNGLYLYLTRMLRPIWTEKIVTPVLLDDNKQYLISSMPLEDLDVLNARLMGLKLFLEKNTTQTNQELPNLAGVRDIEMVSPTNLRIRLQEALAQEKMSLDAFKVFVEHVTQVFGLWRILSQHQFHMIVNSLKPELINQISLASHRDLAMCGKEICSALINSLINLYLNDNASVDNISAKLREVCPSLYKSEDATCSKVNEILMAVKDVHNDEQKMVMLRSAIKLCKEVSPHLNHSSVCKQLVNYHYYQGVIEVCSDMANKADPLNYSKTFLEQNQPPDDQIGSKAYMSRLAAYKELGHMLDQIYMKCHLGNTPITFDEPPNSPGQKVLENTLIKCLSVDDEAAHMVVYDWLVTRNLQGSLVSLGRPSVEKYLSHFPPDSELRDLMWQYHERSGDHAKAAHILYKLATGRGDAIKLQQRLTYLGKAVMCMRSDRVGCAPHLGVFHHELEDLVQVARVQKQILDKITGLINTHAMAEEACKKLNSNLLSITELFEDFAEPFNLWECKLTILNCAGHDDQDLIKSIWNEIIKEELDQCMSSSPDEQMLVVMSKVKSLGYQFTIQSPCFPVYYLVWQLELLSCRLNVNKSRVHSVMVEIGVSVLQMLDIYDIMYSSNDRCWIREGNELHLIQVIASFAECFLKNPRMVPAKERKAAVDQMQELVTACISTLYSKQDCAQLMSYMNTIKNNLERLKIGQFHQPAF